MKFITLRYNVRSGVIFAGVILSLLLIMQWGMVWHQVNDPKTQPSGDEGDYYQRAIYLVKNGSFLPATEYDREVLAEKRFGYGNIRTPGYPAFLAAMALDEPPLFTLRKRAALIQFILAALCVVFLFCFSISVSDNLSGILAVAIILGIQPWSFELVGSLHSDSLAMSLVTLGTMGLSLFSVADKNKIATIILAGSMVFLCGSFTVRPEMIVLVPLLCLVALLLRTRNIAQITKYSCVSLLIFSLFVGINVAYRLQIDGKFAIFGKFSHISPGLHSWSKTWIGTEHMRERAVYNGYKGLYNEYATLPDRIFTDADEQKTILNAFNELAQKKTYNTAIDSLFSNIAERRKNNNWVANVFLVKLWNMVNLWVNTNTNNQLLEVLAPLQGSVRKVILLFLLILRISVLCFAAVSLLRCLIMKCNNMQSATADLLILCGALVIGRTLLIGGYIGEYLHRYMIPSWPAMLWCGVYTVLTICGKKTSELSWGKNRPSS